MDDFDFESQPSAEGGGNFLAQLPVILWQRKWLIIIPAIIGTIAAIVAILVIPPSYRSTATLLVESPQLPEEVIGFEAPDVIDRRLAAIRQQIVTRPDLIELIDRHGLYTGDGQGGSMSAKVEEMREAISLSPTSTAADRGNSGETTITVQLAYEYSNPVQAQAVAQDLMERVLQLDSRGNVEAATNTVQFLEQQSLELESQVADIQGQIAQISAANGGILAGGNMVFSSNAGSYDMQIASLERQNQDLVRQREIARQSDNRDPVVTAAEQRLAAARAVYAESHPDVVFAKQALAEARELAKLNTSKLPLDTIDQQIAFNNQQIAALRSARASDNSRMQSQLERQARTPLIQQQLGELQQELNTLNGRYNDVQTQLMAARAGVRAEDEQMAERLAVIDPPVIPEEPNWPDKLLIAAGGILGGLGLGFILAMAMELLARPIRDPSAIESVLGSPPLGVIPVIKSDDKPAAGWWRRLSFR